MVATKVGGVTDIATDEEDALLVPPRAPHALAMALLKLINCPELRLRLGKAAMARVHNTFSYRRVSKGIVSCTPYDASTAYI